MKRLISAARNSARAFSYLARNEAAFRDELLLLGAGLPVGWVLSPGWRGYALLIGSLIVLIIIEILNTAIEEVCNAVTREVNQHIRLAKDCGSLAVAFAVLLAAGVWGLALFEWVTGLTL